MPDAGSRRADQEDLLRTVYEPDIADRVPLHTVLMQAIGRKNNKTAAPGKEISLSSHTATAGGPIASDRLFLPVAGFEEHRRETFTYRGITDQIVLEQAFIEEAGTGPPSAEDNPRDIEVEALIKRMRNDLDYWLFGDGSGIQANITNATSATTLVLDSMRGIRRKMRVGVLLISSGAATAGVTAAMITGVNRSTKTITIDTALSDYATIAAAPTTYAVYKASCYNNVPYGLEAAISATNTPSGIDNYGGVDRSDDTYEDYRSTVNENGSVPRNPSPLLIDEALEEVRARAGDDEGPDLIVCAPAVWRAMMAEMVGNKRFGGETKTFNMWGEALKYPGIPPIVKAFHCQPGWMWLLNTSDIVIHQNDEGKWQDNGSGGVLMPIEGQVAMRAAWYRMMQMIVRHPNRHAVIKDLAYVGAAA